MRKVTTINLNNNAYQIDEDGYEELRAYLDKAERALASNPDRAEILADLEQAIADKCRLALGPYKTVVSAAEIERILKEMGAVEGAGDAESAADPGNSRTATHQRLPARRAACTGSTMAQCGQASARDWPPTWVSTWHSCAWPSSC